MNPILIEELDRAVLKVWDGAVLHAWDGATEEISRIYGPADRHGVIEWMYDLGTHTSERVRGYLSLAAWVKDDRHPKLITLEAAIGISTDRSAHRQVLQRLQAESQGGDSLWRELETMIVTGVERFNKVVSMLENHGMSTHEFYVQFVMSRASDESAQAGKPLPDGV
jgi:hypothetical protein